MSRTYDAPFYKRLSRNDTGKTGGHQGGIVVPKSLSEFFPHLAMGRGPTADSEIIAELYDGAGFIGTASVRYQIQTWGRERPGEHRLTRNLKPLLGKASEGDALMFERQLGEVNKFKLTLIHRDTPGFQEIVSAGRSGVIGSEKAPATQTDFTKAERLLRAVLAKPFHAVDPEEVKKLSVVQRRVRTELFQRAVRMAYANACAFCGIGMLTPALLPEVEAAHIIPRRVNGSNDPRNGLALCRSHHWAFDQLLWTLTDENEIAVPRAVRRIAANEKLRDGIGKVVRLPREVRLHPASEAMDHHRRRVLQVWGAF